MRISDWSSDVCSSDLDRRDERLALQRQAKLTPLGSLLLRATIVLALIGTAIAIHWFDRGGLVDQVDGHISFGDVLYFTMITITTVGYGDIVPVTPRARMFDTIAVTPIRLFVWLIFLGTAYDRSEEHTSELQSLMRIS